MDGINLISFTVAAVILLIFYKTVIRPFSQKMLELKTEEDLELDPGTLQIFDDDALIEEDKDGRLREKLGKLKKELENKDNGSEEQLKYNMLLEKLKEISTDKTSEVSEMLSSLAQDKDQFKE